MHVPPGPTHELGAPPDEGQELVVVQAPDAVAARRFHPVLQLQASHQAQVPATGGMVSLLITMSGTRLRLVRRHALESAL